jgi:adenine-specific DNA-methyltransferase
MSISLAPPTEGIKYAGSKLKLLPQILTLVKQVKPQTVLDGFAGSTRVSQALAKSGYQLHCNDKAVWSKMFGQCYLQNTQPPEAYQALIEHLNSVSPTDGWFTQQYGGDVGENGSAIQHNGLKKPWQRHNTRKLDGIRAEIDRLALTEVERAVALTSLILALDQVDNTMGHYVSYLKEWSPRSYQPLCLKVPLLWASEQSHHVYQQDIFELLPNTSVDLAYFDPPYGSSNEKMPPSRVRYAAYYHVWASVCLNDTPPLFGKVKRREDSSDTQAVSPFEAYQRNEQGRFIAVEAIEQLIQQTQAKWILLSYSSGGRATAAELHDVIQQHGKLLTVQEIDYKKNVMAEMKWTHQWIEEAQQPNKEFLFLIEK